MNGPPQTCLSWSIQFDISEFVLNAARLPNNQLWATVKWITSLNWCFHIVLILAWRLLGAWQQGWVLKPDRVPSGLWTWTFWLGYDALTYRTIFPNKKTAVTKNNADKKTHQFLFFKKFTNICNQNLHIEK